MDDLISRKALLESIEKEFFQISTKNCAISIINAQPAIEQQKRVAEQIEVTTGSGLNAFKIVLECTGCKDRQLVKKNFCPNCGARFKEENPIEAK